jgi:flagellar motor switch protein FliM
MPLRQIVNLKKGDTLLFDVKADPVVQVRCGDQPVTEGRMGRLGESIAVQVLGPLIRSKTSLAVFEQGPSGKRD